MAPQVVPWPDHWRHAEDQIRCIVPHCRFVTPSHLPEPQWNDILNHCMYYLGSEHDLLSIMLQQTICAVNDCGHTVKNSRKHYKIRALFRHEQVAHGSTEMSDICSFVRLAREGRILRCYGGGNNEPMPKCQEFAFDRMMEKVQALPAAELELLFQKGGFLPGEHTPENLGRTLTHDPLAEAGDDPPFWWPVKVESFLWYCRPDPGNSADDHWRRLRTDLRDRYADGRI